MASHVSRPELSSFATALASIKLEVGIDDATPMKAAIMQANQLMGLPDRGSLQEQVQALAAAVGHQAPASSSQQPPPPSSHVPSNAARRTQRSRASAPAHGARGRRGRPGRRLE